jgi:chromosome segregation ATPase
VRRIALWGTCLLLSGCLAPQSQLTRLREQNAQLAERIRHDQVRVVHLEEQNHQLQQRLGEAERAVATLHDAAPGGTKWR